MKNVLVAFVVLVSTAAFADRPGFGNPGVNTFEGFTSVSCRDARPLADAGIMVAITQHRGVQFLEVSEQTFRGPVALGSVPVRQVFTQQRGSFATYIGQNVSLQIDMDSQRHPEFIRTGEMEGFVRGIIGRARLDHDLRCQFFARAL
jgi:hypothetical protein